MVGAKAGIRAIDEFLPLEHFYQFFLEGNGCRLLSLAARDNAHGQGDAVTVHKKPHFDDGVGTVFLADAILPDPRDDLAGYFIYIILVL